MSTKKKRRLMARAVLPLTAALAVMFSSSAGAATQVAPVNTTAPTIAGTAKVGQALTASDGTWTNTPTSYAYQWLRCNGGGNSCVNVANGTQKTYTLVGADAGRTIRVKVTATNADGATSAQSEPTAAVEPATSAAAPKNTAAPTISGTAKVGAELTANDGTWSGNPTSYAYAWQRCDADIAACTNVVGATGKTYGVRIADLGYRLRVMVTARNAKGSDIAPSAITTIVAPAVTITNRRPTTRDALCPVRGCNDLCALPDLRRHEEESHRPRDRLAARRCLLHTPLHYAGGAEALRRLHTPLDASGPVPRSRPLHRHTPRP